MGSLILIAEAFDITLHTRDMAKRLLQMVADSPCLQVELDFLNVQYISRSFADQFHADRAQLIDLTKREIVIVNANESVVNMLQTVDRTQNKLYFEESSLPVLKYTDWTQLENFLLSI